MKKLLHSCLLFPVFVVVFACCSFFFGGSCSSWQWWISITLTLALPFVGKNARDAIGICIGFICILLLLLLLSPFCIDGCFIDGLVYHFPIVRLLIHGWNPVWDMDAAQILQTLGLSSDGMRGLAVEFTPKAHAVFSAVAYNWIRDPLALTYPLQVMLFISVILSLFCYRHERCQWFGNVLLGAIIYCIVYLSSGFSYVDGILVLSSIGLLITMYFSMRMSMCAGGYCRFSTVIELICYTFWMMNCKLPGVIAAFIFWLMYSLFAIVHDKDTRIKLAVRFAGISVVLLLLFSVVSYNPFICSFIRYGHPLYPFMTIDEVKFPKHDLTADFKIMTEDTKEMGRIGTFVNSLISPTLACAWYKMKLNKTTFLPHRLPWDYSNNPSSFKRSPTTLSARVVFMISFAVLFVFPLTRWFAVAGLLSIFVFPVEYLGYLRYQQWVYGCYVVAILSIFDNCRRFMCTRLWKIIFGVACIIPMAFIGKNICYRLAMMTSKTFEINNMPAVIYTEQPEAVVFEEKLFQELIFNMYGHHRGEICKNTVVLMLKELGRDGETRAASIGRDKLKDLCHSPFGYWYSSSMHVEHNRNWVNRFKYLSKILFVEYPRQLFLRY